MQSFAGTDSTAPMPSRRWLVTVKEVVRSQDLAEVEVTRLNALNEGKGVRYWWQTTRLFPEGESAGAKMSGQTVDAEDIAGA
jgi:hypothetical protein